MSRLSVAQHARADAQQSPALPDERLSPTEARLEEHHEHRIAQLRHSRDRALQTERVNVMASDLTAEERSFADIVRDTRTAIWEAHLKFDEAFDKARKTVSARSDDRINFQREHRITRKAMHPDPVLTAGVLAVAFVGETLTNAVLFADVSRWGLVGGAQWSSVLSLPNLGLGVAAGFCGLRARNHIQPPVRQAGTTVLVLTVAAAALWNLSVAHFRAFAERRAGSRQELLLSDWSEAAAQVFTDPGALCASPHAVLLFGVGCIVFAVSLYHGVHGFSDPYPGYGRVDGHVQRALAHAVRLKSEFFAATTRLTNQAVGSIKKRLRGITRKAETALRILDRARSINLRFARAAADELWVYAACLSAYQTRNRWCRREAAVPARFDAPMAPKATMPEYDWRAMRDRIHGIALSAETAAEDAIIDLHDHRLEIINMVDAQASDPSTASTRPAPPMVRLAREAANANA